MIIKIKITYLLTLVISVLILILGHRIFVGETIGFHDVPNETVRAKVTRIVERVERAAPEFDFFEDFEQTGEDFYPDSNDNFNFHDEYDDSGFFSMMPGDIIVFEARITRGPRRGETVTAEQTFSPILLDRSKEVARGNNVLLVNNNVGWFFGGYVRTTRLLVLGFLFVFCLLFFGGKKGVNTILSLGLTCAAIFAVFVPAILSGKNIYLMSLFVCTYIVMMTPLIVIGYNKKSLASIAGCAAGVIIAGIIALVMDKALYLTGIVDEHSRYLVNLPGGIQFNLNAVIFAGIIIGATGAIMDVSISISSALWELKEKANNIKFRELFRSGINIGRDIMGTMADTLILAYIGSSLTVVLILTIFAGSPLGLFNSEMFAVEILQAMAGSFGILFAMPLTALFCSIIYLRD